MSARELFEKLGYEQKIYSNEKRFVNGFEYTVNGIEYVKEEIVVGKVIRTKYIGFHSPGKEIELITIYEFEDGTKETSQFVLNLELFNAVQKQINELRW